MKRARISLLVLTFLLSASVFCYAGSSFKDGETGLKFAIPDGWHSTTLTEDRDTIDVKFIPDNEDGNCILYGSTDIWEQLTQSEKENIKKKDFNNNIFSLQSFAEYAGCDMNSVSKLTYGDIEYFHIYQTSIQNINGHSVCIGITQLVFFDNGYGFTSQFSGGEDSIYYDTFIELLESVEYNPDMASQKAQNTSVDLTFNDNIILTLIFGLIIAFIVYCLPIIIYRFCIKKCSVADKSAKIISIIYGIVAFAIMIFIFYLLDWRSAPVVATVFWGFVNYKILVSENNSKQAKDIHETVYSQSGINNEYKSLSNANSKENTNKSNAYNNSINEDVSAFSANKKMRYCYHCGAKLGRNSIYCHVCGTKIK